MANKPLQKIKYLFILVTFLFMGITLRAAYFSNLPYSVTQPNGEVINCYVSGDEFFNWLHDANGFTIIQSSDGYYYYGYEEDGLVVPSTYKVNAVSPQTVGLSAWAKISPENYKKRKAFMEVSVDKSQKGPQTGILNNIVIYVRFADDTEFTNTRGSYDSKFNAQGSISLNNYFKEVSYNMLDIVSTHYPICNFSTNLSFQDSYPRNYYQPYNASTNPNGYVDSDDRRMREHTLLVNAVNGVSSEIPVSLNIDADGDNRVDNVSFIIRGNSGAWAELLWAHRWSLYSQTVYIHGKRVMDYTFQPENQTNVQTLCHEMFHSVGAPDLYRYSQDGFTPIGSWDLMASGFVHMGAFMKWKYTNQNWISDIPEITVQGTYTLNPLTSPTGNAYRITSPNNPSEYFVLEYRKKTGLYETNVPGSGIVIYRINTLAGNGNASGPPDEVYLYRPGGTLTDNGTISNAFFSQNVGRTQFNDLTNPSCFLSDDFPGGIEIFDITTADSTISFTFGVDYKPTASFEAIPKQSCTGQISFIDKSTKSPTSWLWDFGDGNTSTLQNPSHIYTTNGYKSVKLKVTNSYGADSLRLLNYIRVEKPYAPNATNQSSCIPATFTLQANAQSGGTLKWYAQQAGGMPLQTGSTFQTPLLTSTTTYYVDEEVAAVMQNAGANDNTIGDGVYFNNSNTHYLVFDAFQTLTIKSVKVYAQSTKNRTIAIKDQNNNILHDTTLSLTTGEHRIELNFVVPLGTNYKIECTTPNALLYRNSNGTAYPYTVNNLLSIHDNSASNPSYYYYFYNWEVIGSSCISLRKPVTASIMNAVADFSHSNNNLNVSFQNTSLNATQSFWHFGDGTTSQLINPQHTYNSEGQYDVKLIITNTCGTDSIIKQIPVFLQDVEDKQSSKFYTLYPNPVKDELIIEFSTLEKVNIELFNMFGQRIFSEFFDADMHSKHILPFNQFKSGVYFLLLNGKKVYTEKIIKL